MVAVLDALQIRRSSFHPLEPSYQILQYGIILLTLVVCFRLIRARFRVKGVARRLAWIALFGGHLAGVMLVLTFHGFSLNTTIIANRCRQVIAGIAQFCLEKPRREWIYYDDIVGPNGYLSVLENVFADDPAENFPFHWDGQEFVVTMNNGYKVIRWSKVPLRELGDVYVFAQKPNGKLRRRLSSSRIDDVDGWPLYLD